MSEDKDRKIKSVSFDLTDPYEAKLLKFVEEQGKFSKYAKRLFIRDMEGQANPVAQTAKSEGVASAVPDDFTAEDKAKSKGYF